MMSKLRVGFTKENHVVFAAGDHIKHLNAGLVLENHHLKEIINGKYDNWEVVAFAPRKNEGAQPCGDDVPVVAWMNATDKVQCFELCREFEWGIDGAIGDVKSWAPDIDAIIKMQGEHDKARVQSDKEKFVNVGKAINNLLPTAAEAMESLGKAFNKAKPRVKVEYVKCEVSEAKNYHTNELFFQYGEKKIEPLKDVDAAFFIINQHKLVRKVEREITWKDEVWEKFRVSYDKENKSFEFGITPIDEKTVIELCEFVTQWQDIK